MICVLVTIVVSLFTTPKTKEQLTGVVWGYTQFPAAEPLPLWKRSIFWGADVAVFFAILQWIFW
jgi:SSS family solute:Na+ symporter